MHQALPPFVATDTTSDAYWMLDILWIVKVHSEQTNGQFSMMEQTMPYGSGAPVHYHPTMEEMFYVLEGEMTICINDTVSVLTPGSLAMIPRKAVHYFKVTSQLPCKVLNMYTPGGFEKEIIRNAQKADRLTLPPPGFKHPVDVTKMNMMVWMDTPPKNLMNH